VNSAVKDKTEKKFKIHNNVNEFIHNGKGNAPPGEKTILGRVVQSYCHFEGGTTEKSATAELKSYRFLSRVLGIGMTSTGGMPLLNMRDGPRGRAPATRFAMVSGLVTLIQKSSVPLCEISVDSVVEKFKPQRTQSRHREHGVISNKGIPHALHGRWTLAGGFY